ncbi:MAG TPA: NUDIX domain-containing protein [Thermoanaerobaculia bacterium]|jgi:8-oxo-dGTP diphosphatase|nr:NUDIX domain-containing protein [Thermoanaerobaculia bacterium]
MRVRIGPSAYAILRNDRGEFAVVRSHEGIFLPGGGMDPGETPHQTVIRETLEECGLTIRIGSWTTSAIQFAWSETEQLYYEKRSTFVDATITGSDMSRLEPDHQIIWADGTRARDLLTHESHGWAVAAVSSNRDGLGG